MRCNGMNAENHRPGISFCRRPDFVICHHNVEQAGSMPAGGPPSLTAVDHQFACQWYLPHAHSSGNQTVSTRDTPSCPSIANNLIRRHSVHYSPNLQQPPQSLQSHPYSSRSPAQHFSPISRLQQTMYESPGGRRRYTEVRNPGKL